MTPCNTSSSANMPTWSCCYTIPADSCVRFASHALLPSVKKQRGDIWVTSGCEIEHQTPPECPRASREEGRGDVSADITSRLAPSKSKVSSQISLYNRQDEKQKPQSDAVCTLGNNGGYIYASCFHVCVSMPRSASQCITAPGNGHWKIKWPHDQAMKINFDRFDALCKYAVVWSLRSKFKKF